MIVAKLDFLLNFRERTVDLKIQGFTFSYNTFYAVYIVSFVIHSLQTSASNGSGLGARFLWFKGFKGPN